MICAGVCNKYLGTCSVYVLTNSPTFSHNQSNGSRTCPSTRSEYMFNMYGRKSIIFVGPFHLQEAKHDLFLCHGLYVMGQNQWMVTNQDWGNHLPAQYPVLIQPSTRPSITIHHPSMDWVKAFILQESPREKWKKRCFFNVGFAPIH